MLSVRAKRLSWILIIWMIILFVLYCIILLFVCLYVCFIVLYCLSGSSVCSVLSRSDSSEILSSSLSLSLYRFLQNLPSTNNEGRHLGFPHRYLHFRREFVALILGIAVYLCWLCVYIGLSFLRFAIDRGAAFGNLITWEPTKEW